MSAFSRDIFTERIREIGGSLEINSSAIGTEIVARVPISKSPLKRLPVLK